MSLVDTVSPWFVGKELFGGEFDGDILLIFIDTWADFGYAVVHGS